MKFSAFLLFFFISLHSASNTFPAYYILIDQSLIQTFTSSAHIEQKLSKHEVPINENVSMKQIAHRSWCNKRLFFAFLIGGCLGSCVVRLVNNRTMVLIKAFEWLKTCYGFLKKGCIAAVAA